MNDIAKLLTEANALAGEWNSTASISINTAFASTPRLEVGVAFVDARRFPARGGYDERLWVSVYDHAAGPERAASIRVIGDPDEDITHLLRELVEFMKLAPLVETPVPL